MEKTIEARLASLARRMFETGILPCGCWLGCRKETDIDECFKTYAAG